MLKLDGSADPVVLYRLVRIENDGVALAYEDVETIDLFGDVVDTVDLKIFQLVDYARIRESSETYLDDGERMALNGKRVAGIGGEVNNAEAVPLALNNIDAGTLDRGTTNVSPTTIDRTRVGHLNEEKMR